MSFTISDLHKQIPLEERITKQEFYIELTEKGTDFLQEIEDTANSCLSWAREISSNLETALKLKALKEYGIGVSQGGLRSNLTEMMSNIHEDINKFQNTRELLNECYIVLKRTIRVVNSSINHLNSYLSENKKNVIENKDELLRVQEVYIILKERLTDEQTFLSRYLDNLIDKRVNQLYRIESSLRLSLGQDMV